MSSSSAAARPGCRCQLPPEAARRRPSGVREAPRDARLARRAAGTTSAWSRRTGSASCPGTTYRGGDPHGFMRQGRDHGLPRRLRAAVDAPLREGVAVTNVTPRRDGGFAVVTDEGAFTADQVVVASGGYHLPIVPRMAERLPADVRAAAFGAIPQPAALPHGAVLVVGSGQSGAQIAEDLHLAGRRSCSRWARAALRALLPRQGRGRLARRHGLLRHAGRRSTRCAKACATTPTTT